MERVKKLQYITCGTTKAEIVNETNCVIDGGCRWVQLRMKNSSYNEMLEVAKELKVICKERDTTLIINDNIELCREIDGDGVHLGKNDASTIEARKILGNNKIIGRTCNSVTDIVAAEREEIDYIGLGPLRFTTTKKLLSPIIGLEGYKEILAASKSTLPVVAVGGITIDDLPIIFSQGVCGVAISGAIAKAANIVEATREFVKII